MRYLEFAVASNFSFLRGASHPEELMLQAGAYRARRHRALRPQFGRRRGARPSDQARAEAGARYHPGARLVFADGTPDILAYPRDRAGLGTALPPAHARQPARRERRLHPPARRSAGAHRRPRAHRDGGPRTRGVAAMEAACASRCRKLSPARRSSGSSRAPESHRFSPLCATPLPAACGSPRRCSIAATTARGLPARGRLRADGRRAADRRQRRALSSSRPAASCRTCSPASAST